MLEKVASIGPTLSIWRRSTVLAGQAVAALAALLVTRACGGDAQR